MTLTFNETFALFLVVLLLCLGLFVLGYYTGRNEGRKEERERVIKRKLQESQESKGKNQMARWEISLKGRELPFYISSDENKIVGDFIVFYKHGIMQFGCQLKDIFFTIPRTEK